MRLPRGRRYAVRGLLIAATVLAVAAIFAVYANRQLLNADNWSNTSSQLLDNGQIRGAVSTFLVDEVYANVDVAAELQRALPPRLAPLAGPAANGLRSLAVRTADEALARPRVQQAWETANRLTAQQFINIAENKSGAITSSGNAVVLDLRVVLLDLVARLGLPGSLAQRIPVGAGRIRIMSGNQVTALQDGAKLVRGLSVVLPVLALGSLALAVWLARGRRRQTLWWSGVVLVSAGAIVLVGREIAGDAVVHRLAATATSQPPAHAAWAIGTGMLRDIAQATVLFGIPLILAAALASPARSALALRRATAPWLRERPALAYGVAGVLLALVVWWGPIAATRKPIPVVLMAALLALGVTALRRQTAEEFPAASVADAHASLRERAERIGRALVPSRAHGAATDGNGNGTEDRLALLERLAELHDRGVLDDAEFAAEKTQLLSRPAST